ncbi:MAG TPA: VPLPA-CTERM-specific exosortase XrtD, partial [Alphaproteobacteria bacterium]|nr:VPLPA-CTERM-specific exosortase XrtD [Alphaproteobacteria bacterium]
AALLLLGQLSAFPAAGQYGLIVGFGGLSLAFLGRAASRAVAAAFFYLIFAVPLPHLIEALLSQKLQLLSSSLGVAVLNLFEVPVYQAGNVIDLGTYRLQVAEACDGLRYLFPLLSFGFLVAYLLKDRLWKRIVIFVSAVPIAIGLNALRIAFVGFTVDLWGDAMAKGFIHAFEGWAVFLACIALLLGEAWGLRHIGTGGYFRWDYLGPASRKLFGGFENRRGPRLAALLAVLLMALAFGTGRLDHRAEIIPYHPPLASFPLSLGDWHGTAENLSPAVLDALRLSDYWLASYARPRDSAPVNLYIAYYARQHVGAAAHTPSNCMPGGGWEIDSRRAETLALPGGAKVALTRLLIRRGDAAAIVYYWFDERGRDMTETIAAKWYLLRDSILMNRSDGAVIRLIAPLAPGESAAAAGRRIDGFLAAVYPKIGAFIPGARIAKAIDLP